LRTFMLQKSPLHISLFLVLVLSFCSTKSSLAQNETKQDSLKKGYIQGKVLNAADDIAIEDVNIVNLNQIKGTITNSTGNFKIKAAVHDTLYFSYLGFKSIQVEVTKDWLKYGDVKIKMTEIGYTLNTVDIASVQLTGYLEIDAKNIPIYENYQYRISGLNMGYEGGANKPGSFAQTMDAIFDPANLLYKVFGSRPKQMRKLREMKKNDEIRNLLAEKFDRETLAALLRVDEVSIDQILENCNYSDSFIKNANDLQVLDAINSCYEEYRVLKDRK